MRVLVLGGTGSIGGAIVQVLIERHHEVYALVRSPASTAAVRKVGAIPISGDIRYPAQWINSLGEIDGVVHAAYTWEADMDSVDQSVVAALLTGLKSTRTKKALIYTGGCWLYGNTGDGVATENTPLSPLTAFSSTVQTMKSVLADSNIRGMVVHPAMVYEHAGGVFERMYDDIKRLGYIRIIGSAHVRWPLVHRMDLAVLYALVLEKGCGGDAFNGSAMNGIAVGDIAHAIARSKGVDRNPVIHSTEYAIREWGAWADGFALDQQMSSQKAKAQLGWQPQHVDVFKDID